MARVTSTPPESPYGPAAPGPGAPGPLGPAPGPVPAAAARATSVPVVVEHRWGDAASDAWWVNVRCQAVLAVVAVVAAVAFGLSGDAGETAQIMIYVWVVHAVMTLVVGYPVGVVAARLLPAAPSRGAATGGFLLAGGVTGALLMCWAGPFAALGWGALGAVTAGGARAWAHGAIERRRARWSRPPLVPHPGVAWVPGTPPREVSPAETGLPERVAHREGTTSA